MKELAQQELDRIQQSTRNAVWVDIDKIKPYENNPRINEKAVKKVKESILRYGFNVPITVDKDGVIATGHTRYKAALELGLKKVLVIYLDDLTEEEIQAWRLVDNRTNEYAEWDMEKLNIELKELDSKGFDLSDFDFEIKEEGEVKEDDFDFDKAYKELKFKTKRGDVYQLGDHRLMCGDSALAEDVDKLVGGGLIDLLITDPPYNVNYTANGTREGIQNDNFATPEAFCQFLTDAFANANLHLKAGACFYIYFADKFASEVTQACKNIGWDPRHILVWKKDSLVLGQCDYQYIHEPFIYGFKEGAAHSWYNDRKQVSVIEFARPKASKLHPTMKPVALFAYQIRNSSKAGDLVLDLFGGSGTTLVVCEEIGRRCLMMEKDPKYADVIIARWEQMTGKKAVKIND